MRTEEDIRAAFRALVAEGEAAEAVPTASHGETLHQQPARRRRRRWAIVAPVAAAAVVIALAVSLSLGGAGNRPSQAAAATEIKQSLPPYFLALHERPPKTFPAGAADVLVRSSLTGAPLATVRPPEPYATFIAVTGAADDHTFVLAAQRTNDFGSYGPIAFFLGRLSPSGKDLTLKLLPIPKVPGHSARPGSAYGMDLVGLALSPDGTSLAMMISEGPGDAEAVEPIQLKIYSLTTGAVKVWQARGHNFYGYETGVAVSWSEPGAVAFTWAAESDNGAGAIRAHFSVRLLSAGSGEGNLIADSRLVVASRQTGGFGPLEQGKVTADSRAVVVLDRTRWSGTGPNPHPGLYEGSTVKIGIFSTATSKLIRTIPLPADIYPNLVWSNASASVIVAGPIPITDSKGNSVGAALYAFGANARVPIVTIRVTDSYDLQGAAF